MNQEQQVKLGEIQKQCYLHIDPYFRHINLSDINFPIIKVTYSLWRKVAYQMVIEKNPTTSIKLIGKILFRISQKQLLPSFIQKLFSNMKIVGENFKKIVMHSEVKQIQNEEEYQLFIEYGSLLWKQQVYVELIQDLVRLPYLEVLPKTAQLHVRQQFTTIFSKKKPTKTELVVEKVGKTAVVKGLNFVAENILKSKALFQINALVGTFNPMMMALTFGISTTVQTLSSKNHHASLIQDLKKVKQMTGRKLERLQQCYICCLQLINGLVNLAETEEVVKALSSKLKEQFFVVFESEWLNIEISEEGQWEIVKIEETQNFQNL